MRVLFLLAVVVLTVGGYATVEHLCEDRATGEVVDRYAADGVHTVTLLSERHRLDKLYPSMRGPYAIQEGVTLLESPEPELLWLTGLRTEVLDDATLTPISPEFFCHANLTLNPAIDPAAHNRRVGEGNLDWRLFTLVPGRLEIRLPEGFAIPLYSDEPLDYLSMALNQNVTDRTVDVRFRTDVTFVRDAELDRPPVPLFRRAVYGFEPLDGEATALACREAVHPGESCGPFRGVAASDAGFVASVGKDKTIHWMLGPGAYRSRTSVTEQLDLDFDTRLHYVTAHLHPYGRSIEFRDVTADRTLFTITSRDFEDRLGVAHMSDEVFPEGIPLRHDHHYEIVTTYENTSEADADAMSIVYLYLREPAAL